MDKLLKVKGNSWTWLETEFGNGLKEVIDGRVPEYPAHVEIHPHHSSTILCNNSCPGCTGLIYNKHLPEGVGIIPQRLIATIDSLKDKVKRIVFSGNCIEPLLYPEMDHVIRHVRGANIPFSLYSNFYYANKEGLMEELLDTPRKDYVRASINSGSEETYNLVHSPLFKDTFKKVFSNVRKFAEMKVERDSPVFLHLTYLLTRDNSNENDLTSAVRFAFENKGINGIRFSTYQKPLGRRMPNSSDIPQAQYEETLETLSELKQKYRREKFEVDIFDAGILCEQKEKPFSRCYVQDIFPVIGFDGSVTSCTAMAAPQTPSYYKFGNINTEDFWDIWNNKHSKRNFVMDGCYDCTRAEFDINNRVQSLVDLTIKGNSAKI
jgi:radical SAM protein with 4Fe4S-binding SPASM domain